MSRGWHGVDLDGTLAEYHGWKGMEDIGQPIPAMVEQVRKWLKAGDEVRIVTARVGDHDWLTVGLPAVQDWCIGQFNQVLTVTNVKDYGMIDLWDDRAVAIEHNTGRVLGRPAEIKPHMYEMPNMAEDLPCAVCGRPVRDKIHP